METHSNRTQFADNQWTDSLRPTKLSEMAGNNKAIIAFKAWLNGFDKDKSAATTPDPDGTKKPKKLRKIDQPKASAVIFGPHGVGKTTMINMVLNQLGYTQKTINYDIVKEYLKKAQPGKTTKKTKKTKRVVDKKKATAVEENDTDTKKKGKTKKTTDKKKTADAFLDQINFIIGRGTITSAVEGDKSKKKIAIVIDDLESISSTNDRNFILKLQKLNNTEWMFPIIFVSNDQHSKMLNEIKKNALNVRFYNPTNRDMLQALDRIAKLKQIRLDSLQTANKLIEVSQSEFRSLVSHIQELFNTYGKSKWTEAMIDKYIEFVKQKDLNGNLYNISGILLYGYQNIDDTLRCYEMDKVLHPLMIQENYVSTLTHKDARFIKDQEMFDLAERVADSLSLGDVVENYIFSGQNWILCDVHGFYSCVNTSYHLTKTRGRLKWNPELTQRDYSFDFPNDLNRTSTKKINYNKHVVPTKRELVNKNEIDCMYANNIINHMVANGNLDAASNCLSGYTPNCTIVENLLKVDKVITDAGLFNEFASETHKKSLIGEPAEVRDKMVRTFAKQHVKSKTIVIGKAGRYWKKADDDDDE